MATEEEKRRRRLEEQAALADLTPAYMEMLERQLARQRGEGKPEGEPDDYYTPPLTKYAPISGDRRSERTGLMRPVGNILDRLLRPGWQASMNRRQRDLTGQRQAYAEQRPMQAAQQSALLTDSQLEALKQKSSDPNATPDERAAAMKHLSSYVQALSTRAGGVGVPNWSQIAGGGGSIDAGGGADVVRRERGDSSGDADDKFKPLTRIVDDSMTPVEAEQAVSSSISSIDEEIQRIEADKDRGKHTEVHAQQAGGSGFPSSYSSTTDVENTIGWNKQADARLKELNAERTALKSSEYAPRGSATVATPE
jgi:hypothetical protein